MKMLKIKNNNNRKKNAFNWMINKLNKPKEPSGKTIHKLTKIVIKISPNLKNGILLGH